MLFKRRRSKKVFRKLAAKNVKKSMKDYFIYFFTLTFAVCLFYTFKSIGAQFAAFQIPDTLNYLEAAKGAMAGVSVLVCGIVGFLVVYANRFLMKRRKKEFGIYSVLGMERKDISKILMKETIRVGGVSLAAGILLGIVASQGLTMITGKIAGVGLKHYAFIFSPGAVLASVVFFALVFLCVHLFNVREVKKMKLIDLLYAERKNEGIAEGKKRGVLTGLCGLLLVAAGYFIVFYWADKEIFKSMGIGSTVIGLGTLFLFFAAAGVILNFLKKRKGFYYRKLNLFVVNQLGSRMKSAGVSVAVVCILMYLSVSIIGVGMGLGQSSISIKDTAAPYDVSVEYEYYGRNMDEEVKQKGMLHVLEERQAALPECIGKTNEMTFYNAKNLKMIDVFANSIGGDKKIAKIFDESTVEYMGIDDYNELRAFQGKEPISLKEGEYAVNYNAPEAEKMLKTYEKQGKTTLELEGTPLTLKKGALYRSTLYNRNVLLDYATLIVPQSVADRGKANMQVLNGMFANGKEDSYDALQEDYRKAQEFHYIIQKDIHVEILADKLTVSYIGGYLGIIFLVTAGAVLALQQLTQSADNQRRYDLLYKMGAGEEMMKRSLMTQMIFYFGLPFGIAAVHSGVIMAAVYRNIPYLTAGDVVRNISFAAGLVAVIYGIYFMTTYAGSKRILNL